MLLPALNAAVAGMPDAEASADAHKVKFCDGSTAPALGQGSLASGARQTFGGS